MADGAGKPKPAFFIAVLAVVAGLVGLAFYRCNAKKSTGTGSGSGDYVDPNIVKKGGSNGSAGSATAENPDPNAPPTTVTEYSFEPATTLPEVPGTAAYESLGKPRVVKFAVNVGRLGADHLGQRRQRAEEDLEGRQGRRVPGPAEADR